MSPLDKAILIGRLNERIKLISDPSIYGFVRKMLDLAPSSYYNRAASTRHHLPDERRQHGNLLHTIRVVDLAVVIADTCDMEKIKLDILIASAILHDMCRHGVDGNSEHSRKDHPQLVRKVAEEHNLSCVSYESIMRTIESHMGRWGDPPFTPDLMTGEILHIADAINARWLECNPKGEQHDP